MASNEEKGEELIHRDEGKRPLVAPPNSIILNQNLDPNHPVKSFLELKLAIITARLATIQALIKQKNIDLAEAMTQINMLKTRGDEIERTMGTGKRAYRHLIDVYKTGLNVVQGYLRQAMI